jgi:hypothetical protein
VAHSDIPVGGAWRRARLLGGIALARQQVHDALPVLRLRGVVLVAGGAGGGACGLGRAEKAHGQAGAGGREQPETPAPGEEHGGHHGQDDADASAEQLAAVDLPERAAPPAHRDEVAGQGGDGRAGGGGDHAQQQAHPDQQGEGRGAPHQGLGAGPEREAEGQQPGSLDAIGQHADRERSTGADDGESGGEQAELGGAQVEVPLEGGAQRANQRAVRIVQDEGEDQEGHDPPAVRGEPLR